MAFQLSNVEAILALDSEYGLAKDGKIPWKSKTDMIFFKNKTINNYVIMGSKTLFTLPNAQPLGNRTNIVVTNQKEKFLNIYKNIENIIFFTIDETIKFIKNNPNFKFFIIGGNQIYNLLLPYCSTIWLTKIKQNYYCDLKFNYNISSYQKELIYEDSELEIFYFYSFSGIIKFGNCKK